MQLVKSGPDVPERLLQDHEDGRVAFFCGAGISCPAQLPMFAGLVNETYEKLSVTPNDTQAAAIKSKQFDTALGLLENDIVGGRGKVRNTVATLLTPDLNAKNATRTHEALLTLGKNREGHTRIVTTNFDRLFEEVIQNQDLPTKRYYAPLLPVPKNRWDGLIYLHGLLPAEPTVNDLDCLVVSSGDFGLAYLTERWAARFVSELFRNYTVCFIGYSIDDPVLRYMMDALAADKLLGESPPEMFAFGNYSKGKCDRVFNEWRAKNVTPILYRQHYRHAYLHRTLWEWADTYRDGVTGKERIVVDHAMAKPLASTQQDNFVSRLIWALSDSRGLPAKRFAEHDPVPSLDWLEPFSEKRYNHQDLIRFQVPPKSPPDKELAFSLTRRPAPYDRAPLMALVLPSVSATRWDKVMEQLAHWLVRHLDDPELILWIVKHGSQVHDELASLIERAIDEISKLQLAGKEEELEQLRESAPNAIPRPIMRTLWGLLLSGRVKSQANNLDFYTWKNRFEREGWTATQRLELRKLLTPFIVLSKPFSWPDEDGDGEAHKPERVIDVVNWELVLATENAHYNIREMKGNQVWEEGLKELLLDFSSLLKDALLLRQELGGADKRNDFSYMHQPSISEHDQNKDTRDWTVLIDLSRDAWLATKNSSPAAAFIAATAWMDIEFPIFRKLSFFAATHDEVVDPDTALNWLLIDDSWWLWSVETEREAIRLLVSLMTRLNDVGRQRLEAAVLMGPPRDMFAGNMEEDRWQQIRDHEIWLRLAKIADVKPLLNEDSKVCLLALSEANSDWKLAEDQSDEFPVWYSDGEEWQKFNATPRRRHELIQWLQKHPEKDHWQKDDWRQRCRDDFPTTSYALCKLARDHKWFVDRWREALQAWSEEKLHECSWRCMASTVLKMPDAEFRELARSVSWWLQSIAKSFSRYENLFVSLARRILSVDYDDQGKTDDPVHQAINYPVGQTTEALLIWWYRNELKDGQRLSEPIREIFTEICNRQIPKFIDGRVLLAQNVITLFRVDQEWSLVNLLPLFDWNLDQQEARAAWEGFLWSPRLYRPLLEELKRPFLDTAGNYRHLGKHGEQYAALLAFAALDSTDIFTITELRNATHSLTPDGLHDTARALVRTLDGSGEQRADYWRNSVAPYLQKIWPKDHAHNTLMIGEALGNLCVLTDEAFPEALDILRGWLQRVAHPHFIVHQLHEARLDQRFAREALEFLDLVIADDVQSPPRDLNDCLHEISAANSELVNRPSYMRLRGVANT